jgi:hypothetical protein
MASAIAQRVIDTVGQEQFHGDAVLAYLWNSAAHILGYTDVISRLVPVTEADLLVDIEAVLSRPYYLGEPELQALRAGA